MMWRHFLVLQWLMFISKCNSVHAHLPISDFLELDIVYVSELCRVGWVSLWFSGIPPMSTKDQVSDWNPSASWGRERCLLAVFWALCRFFPVTFTTIGCHRSINSACSFAGWWEKLSGFNVQQDNGSKFSPPFLGVPMLSNKIFPLSFSERGVCLPTVSLWILFVYIEAAIRFKDLKNFHVDLCRPFAAHW